MKAPITRKTRGRWTKLGVNMSPNSIGWAVTSAPAVFGETEHGSGDLTRAIAAIQSAGLKTSDLVEIRAYSSEEEFKASAVYDGSETIDEHTLRMESLVAELRKRGYRNVKLVRDGPLWLGEARRRLARDGK